MNLKLILQLSLFGLIMAFATVSLIPEKVEWIFWLVILIFVAFVIAKAAPGKYFWHGFLVSIFNSFWVTAVHLYFLDSYTLHHPEIMTQFMEQGEDFSMQLHSMVLLLAIPSGVGFGIIQGLFAFAASKLVKPNVVA